MIATFSEACKALHDFARLTEVMRDADEHGEVVKQEQARELRRKARYVVATYLGLPYPHWDE